AGEPADIRRWPVRACPSPAEAGPGYSTLLYKRSSLVAARRNSSERALGMDDFGRIAWHWSCALAVLLFDHPEDFHQFCQSLLCCWHQGVAPGNGRNLSHPSIGLVSIEHDLVIIEAHVPSFYPGRAIVSAITRSIA